jgi:hypothetical protein
VLDTVQEFRAELPQAADPALEIAELRALLAEREAELAVARAELA